MAQFKTSRVSAELPAEKTASPAILESKWNNVWTMIFFWGNLLALTGVIGSYASQRSLYSFWSLYRPGLVAPVFLLSGGFSFAFVRLVQAFPDAMVYGSAFGSCGLLIASGLCTLASGKASAMGAGILVTGGVGLIIAFKDRPMFYFTATLLRSVARAIDAQPGLWIVPVGAIVFQFLFITGGWFAYAAIESSKQLERLTVYLLKAWLFFTLFWTLQVIWNLVHTTVAGSVATYYLGSAAGKSPIRRALSRAVTLSFGSICLGSLLVTVLRLLRFPLVRLRALIGERRGFKSVNVLLDFLVDIIENLTKFFNYYAFVYVAVYGKPFAVSGWSAWEMLKRSRLMALADANLIAMMNYLVGFCASVLMGNSAYSLHRLYTGTERGAFAAGYTVFVLVWLNMAGFSLLTESAGSTAFVCMAEDPDAVRHSDPNLHSILVSRSFV